MKQLSWKQIMQILENCPRVILRGRPGTGKTTTPILMAIKREEPFFTVTLTDDTSVQECVGHWMPKGGGVFAWHDGPFSRAWRCGEDNSGGLLVINEVTRASGAVLTELFNFLDDPKSAYKSLPNGETIRPGKNFRVVATTNDDIEMLPEALRNRFEARITVNSPHPDAIKSLAEPYRSFVERAYKNPENNSDVTFRDVLSLQNLIAKDIDPRVASFAVFGERGDEVLISLGVGERASGQITDPK